MENTIRFSRKGFNKGVNDTMTLRPLRSAVAPVIEKARSAFSGKTGTGRDSDGSRSSNERRNTPALLHRRDGGQDRSYPSARTSACGRTSLWSRTLWRVGHTNIHRRTDPRCASRAPGDPGSNERIRLRNLHRNSARTHLGTRNGGHSRQSVDPQQPTRRTDLANIGAWFLFLPLYSPDLNPIEMAFAKLKAHLRRIGARTFDTLIEALGNICHLFKPEECRNFLKAAGYASH